MLRVGRRPEGGVGVPCKTSETFHLLNKFLNNKLILKIK